MNLLKRALMVILSLAMTSCHIFFTGPLLWEHGSSAALDSFIGIWVLCIAAIVLAWMMPLESKKS